MLKEITCCSECLVYREESTGLRIPFCENSACLCHKQLASMPTPIENYLSDFDKYRPQFENQSHELIENPELAESSVGHFGYMVRRGNELFKIVDFGNIKWES
jgi:hypothetical protein